MGNFLIIFVFNWSRWIVRPILIHGHQQSLSTVHSHYHQPRPSMLCTNRVLSYLQNTCHHPHISIEISRFLVHAIHTWYYNLLVSWKEPLTKSLVSHYFFLRYWMFNEIKLDPKKKIKRKKNMKDTSIFYKLTWKEYLKTY